jgi:hypothetical protein
LLKPVMDDGRVEVDVADGVNDHGGVDWIRTNSRMHRKLSFE